MREVVFINIGQAGVQISNAVWELFCVEHSIGPDGMSFSPDSDNNSEAFTTIFHEVPSGKFVPRVISVDLEPTVMDEVRTGCYRNLFHPDQLVSGYEDAANNYARGHFTMGRKIIDSCLSQLRKLAQACSYVQGFFLIDSLGGGTGSGFSILLNERLSIEYTKRPKFQVGVFPSPKLESSVVSPYNTLMNTHASMDYIDLSVIMDNEATYDICVDSLMIQRPTFNNVNRLVAQVLSSMTVSLRFENSLNSDLDQLCTNLVPYPRIHFPTSHYAPMHSKSRIDHELSDELDLTRLLFTPDAQFVKVDNSIGKLMACVMQYRGDCSPKKVNHAIFEIKRRSDIRFVDWCPTGFKVGINSFPPTIIPNSYMAPTTKSVTMLCNTTSICQMWESLNLRFDCLYSKRAFIHWYVGEGMEEGEFNEARDNVESIIKDYIEVTLSDEEFVNGPNSGPNPNDYNDEMRRMSKKSKSSENINVNPPEKKPSRASKESVEKFDPQISQIKTDSKEKSLIKDKTLSKEKSISKDKTQSVHDEILPKPPSVMSKNTLSGNHDVFEVASNDGMPVQEE